jgi:hypothetical protein
MGCLLLSAAQDPNTTKEPLGAGPRTTANATSEISKLDDQGVLRLIALPLHGGRPEIAVTEGHAQKIQATYEAA